MIIILITIIEIIVIVITITKIKVIKKKESKEKKSVIRTGEWNNMISLFVFLSLYSNVIILTNN